MQKSIQTSVLVAGLVALAGCGDVGPTTSTQTYSSASAGPVENTARAACVQAVRVATGNADVSVLNTAFSEAGTLVNLRVGPTGTWQCIGYSDGTTAGVMSTTDEGQL